MDTSLEHGIFEVYGSGSLKTLASEMAKYNLDLLAEQAADSQQAIIHFSV
jgi:hypothetical protein